jgi:enterochelin esterase-like enzyme/outer membrane protein assembly factor BamB
MLFSAQSPIHRRSLFGLALAASLAAQPALADASFDWPHFRGPAHGGPAGAGALPKPEALEVAWKKDLGSGYSGISVAGGKVVTMATSGADDVLVALDASSGDELWRLKLDTKYVGHDGSDDGPLSTPAIDGGVVYALGPKGALVAAALDSGKELWRVQLDDKSATVPFYGFTASPLVWRDLVVLPTGGDNRAVTAFDKKTGKPRWSAESGAVAYQSVTALQLAGREQLVAVANQWLAGLDPATGKTLWKQVIAEGNATQESAHVTPIGPSRLLVDLVDASVAFDIVKGADGALAVKEAFRSRAFADTFALPVHHEGVIYGFTGRFLTAIDAASGEILWRSRPPGGNGVALVDGKLVVLDLEGNVVVIEANRQEYREIARAKALDNGNFAPPAVAGGNVFVRNLSQIAGVRPAKAPAGAAATANTRATRPPQELQGEFGRYLAKVKAAPAAERQKLVDDYFAKVKTTPIVEPGLVHIVYRGEAEDVGVAGTFLSDNEADRPLERVEGTNLFFRSEKLDNDGIWTYSLLVSYGDPAPDPNNPAVIPDVFGAASELRMPGVPPTDYLGEPAKDAPRGTLDTFRWRNEKLGNVRRVSVYTPPGYEQSADRYPVLVVNHGDRALRSGLYQNTLDNLIAAKKIAPLIAVFVPRAVGPEYGGPPAGDYVAMLTGELLPHIDKHYRTDPKQRAAIGVGSAGLISTYAGLKSPETFQKVAVQSFYFNGPIREEVIKLLEAKKGGPAFLVEWSRHDYDTPRAQIDAKADAKLLIEKLKAGGTEVKEFANAGEAGWGRWRSQTGALLAAMFPPAK